LLLLILAYIIFIVLKRKDIAFWGRRVLTLAIAGLALCCLVVIRDDYAESLQGGTGFFPLDSIQIYVAYALGAVNGFAALSTLLVRRQPYREAMFHILSSSIIIKAVMVEVSRIILA
jgi:hypothetical protein